jgi:hypothetical protein
MLDVECCPVGIGNPLASWIVARIEARPYDQPSRGLCAANAANFSIHQIIADLTKP